MYLVQHWSSQLREDHMLDNWKLARFVNPRGAWSTVAKYHDYDGAVEALARIMDSRNDRKRNPANYRIHDTEA